ncbi:hypothetical protein [Geothrix sp. 21YS21S-4]|uniref:hypothetical protein n=1 Tax=Geothrix sp. 21YS21S-4 TaxID=3068889 RepID=UPI0027B941BE|nr:hypothetical protein [Geothrix sp. 21YS21S-4]
MGRGVAVAAIAVLLGALGCQPRTAAPVFAPWEEGLTLAYEDPTLPFPQRTQERLQVRVAKAALAPGAAARTVQLTLSSPRGQMEIFVRHQAGGVALLADGRPAARILPEGFPAVAAWEDRGTSFRVIGRGAWEGAAILPETSPSVGVWVEATSPRAPQRRTLYLPNLGEVETLEERGGAWVAVNRLVGRGFVDFPAPRP